MTTAEALAFAAFMKRLRRIIMISVGVMTHMQRSVHGPCSASSVALLMFVATEFGDLLG